MTNGFIHLLREINAFLNNDIRFLEIMDDGITVHVTMHIEIFFS